MLANLLAQAVMPTTHAKACEDPSHSSGEAFRRVLGVIENTLHAHNKTNFTDVSAFNELIGNAAGVATIEQIDRQIQLIESEFVELLKGFDAYKLAWLNHDKASNTTDEAAWHDSNSDLSAALIEIRDGIADVLVTTYGLAHRMGIDADKDMLAVSTSNASKFFTGTEGDAAQVCKALADSLGIKVEQRRAAAISAMREDGVLDFDNAVSVWAFVSADDSDPERPRGKLLKAPGYKPPVFD